MEKIYNILNTSKAAVVVWVFVLISAASNHFLSDHIDVSTAGAASGDVLTFDGTRGWTAEPPGGLTLEGTSNQQIIYNNSGAIGGSSGLTWDGASLDITGTLNPQLLVERTNTGAAYIKLRNSSNEWWWYTNNANSGFEPAIADALFYFRDLANNTFFTINTAAGGLITVGSSAQFRVTGKGGTATGLTAYDSDGDLTDVTLGAGIALTAGTISTDQTATETTYDNSTSGLVATNVKSAIDETVGLIPDNIADLTISADVDIDNNKIVNLSPGTTSTDAATYGQLTGSHALALVAGTNGDTITLTNRETLLILDGALADPATFYIDGSGLSSGAKIYIKYAGFTGNATLDRDDDNDPGNFSASGSSSGTTTLTYTGVGTSMLLKSGATWYQMY